MARMLLHAHSGIRYLVLAVGVAAVVYLVWAVASGRAYDRASRIVTSIFTGVLDLQVLLGVLVLLANPWYAALVGHVATMVVAVGVAHAGGIVNRRRPENRRSNGLALATVAVALLLILVGIRAIGRSIL
jgi:hypothetical protein